ncbi:leucyl aminopeptidase [Candidatus Woesearchaeota archaeon]|nr:leucyl aminopeptidase [Candidatus Woesearchaeota archaeon]
MVVRVIDVRVEDFSCDVVVVGVFVGKKVLPSQLKVVDEKTSGALHQVLQQREFEGEWGQSRMVPLLGKVKPRNVLFVGLGKQQEATVELLRKAAGLFTRVLRDVSCFADLAFLLHEVDVPGSREERAQAVAEGVLLGAYQYVRHKTVDLDKIKLLKSAVLFGKGIDGAVKKGVVLAECANLVRDLENEPASNLHPKELADEAVKLEKLGVKVTVHDKKSIEKLGLHALLAVNRGSVNEPRFVIMEYKGGGKRKVALVGKGITFDSGGLDIKSDESMLTMKHDMAGAGVVIGTVRAASMLKLPVHVFGVFAATENMPGVDAYKPGDVVKTFSGKTIEVANTDAEGRVILSDALAFTEKVIKPDAMVDLATLTGACVVALGGVCAGVMGKDKKVIDALIASGTVTGERLWELPFFREYHDQVKSEIADVRNLGIIRREAGAITAGAFLAAFVETTPWAHVDIAGTSWSEQEQEYVRKGGTGFGVRLLVNFLESFK